MQRKASFIILSLAMPLLFASPTAAQVEPAPGWAPEGGVLAADPAPTVPQGPPPPIPPFVEGAPIQAPGGGYCFDGPHPLDARVSGGALWDGTAGRHIHPYPPFDLRIFTLRDGCYYFIGDPNDFGHVGQTYSYYGAHPIHETYGGGWCFMIGGHHHFWRPFSPLFVTVGPWFYWQGAYDPYFWTYWPYYHFYYRSHYPRYYGGGVFGRARAIAPRITSVPPPPRARSVWQGSPQGAYRSTPMAPGYRPAPAAPGFRSAPGYRPAPSFTPRGFDNRAAPRSFSAPRFNAPSTDRGSPTGGGSSRGDRRR